MSQSEGLSERHLQMSKDGQHLTDDSIVSENTLNEAMKVVIPYADEKVKEIFKDSQGNSIAKVVHKKQLTLYECQNYFHKAGGPSPDPSNQNVFMKPDGGIIFAVFGDKHIPLLIVEDKVQGTNDNLFKLGKKKQATGNAIERGAKNIRGAEMIFSDMDVFPYLLFASGCDFHSSETISKRIEMMNMGVPNHYIDVTPDTTSDMMSTTLTTIVSAINIKKLCGKGIASVFVKAHKWNQMEHGSSRWKKNEIVTLCKKAIDQVLETLKK